MAHPVVVLANHYQFTRDFIVPLRREKCCVLLWCVAGGGRIGTGTETVEMAVHDFLYLPWNHQIAYTPDPHAPFLMGGVYLIPDHALRKPIIYNVSIAPDDELAAIPWRRTAAWPICTTPLRGSLLRVPALAHLAEYTVSWFERGAPRETEARKLADLFFAELTHTATVLEQDAAMPERLRQLLDYLQTHLDTACTLPELAARAGCSPSTVGTLFRRHLHTTPMQWLIHRRMEQAAHLLCATSLTIGEVGRRVGIPDPFFFSKQFKQHTRLSPSSYRLQFSHQQGERTRRTQR